MPGNVSAAAPATVLPQSLCSAFTQTVELDSIANEYRDGSAQREVLVSATRRKWQLSKRLSASALSALRTFFEARSGELEAFYFYDPFESSPTFGNYDATGVSTNGRFTVRFAGGWSQSIGLGRADCSFGLQEIA